MTDKQNRMLRLGWWVMLVTYIILLVSALSGCGYLHVTPSGEVTAWTFLKDIEIPGIYSGHTKDSKWEVDPLQRKVKAEVTGD